MVTTIKPQELVGNIVKEVTEKTRRVEKGEIPSYTFGDMIYRVDASPLKNYRLDMDEKPVLNGCIAGILFHGDLYKTNEDIIRKALTQIFSHTGRVVVSTVGPGGWGRKDQEYLLRS